MERRKKRIVKLTAFLFLLAASIFVMPQKAFADENADEHPFEESEIEDAGFTLDDVEDDDILEDLDDSESGAMFSFDISADDEEI